MIVTIFVIGLIGCNYEREVQASISVGKVIKVEQLQYKYLIKVKDLKDSVIYADYFSKTPLTIGETILIIIKR